MLLIARQILNYSVALSVFTLTLTVIVLWRPKGPQPAAYGHVQTLANVIDEWSATMWWGHKHAGFLYSHAGEYFITFLDLNFENMCVGTSDGRLGQVDMNVLYA